ncbi:MAG: hypothetical protein BJ554DRAFT_1982, partial [Olpidium bornovanus]
AHRGARGRSRGYGGFAPAGINTPFLPLVKSGQIRSINKPGFCRIKTLRRPVQNLSLPNSLATSVNLRVWGSFICQRAGGRRASGGGGKGRLVPRSKNGTFVFLRSRRRPPAASQTFPKTKKKGKMRAKWRKKRQRRLKRKRRKMRARSK